MHMLILCSALYDRALWIGELVLFSKGSDILLWAVLFHALSLSAVSNNLPDVTLEIPVCYSKSIGCRKGIIKGIMILKFTKAWKSPRKFCDRKPFVSTCLPYFSVIIQNVINSNRKWKWVWCDRLQQVVSTQVNFSRP